MHAWLCENPVGPSGLQWRDVPTPQPQAGEVLIEIKAASLNFPDLLITEGKYQFKPQPPFVPGAEFAGVVAAVGSGVNHVKPGDAVATFAGIGGFATHAIAPAHTVMPLPEGFTFAHAAAFLCTYGTMHHGLIDRGELKSGETVLVLGAAGGIGTASIQIALAAGAQVIAAASTDEKCSVCQTLGAHATVNYSEPNFRERLKALTDGKGPDVIVDPVGGSLAESAFRSIAWRGRYLVIGFADGEIPTLPLNLPLLKGASIVGVFWGEFAKREPMKNAAGLMQLAQWYAQGRIKPVVHTQLKMSELPAGFDLMSKRRVIGKLVLTND